MGEDSQKQWKRKVIKRREKQRGGRGRKSVSQTFSRLFYLNYFSNENLSLKMELSQLCADKGKELGLILSFLVHLNYPGRKLKHFMNTTDYLKELFL